MVETARKESKNERRFCRGSWIVLGASTFLILSVLLVNAYRFTLPTDGWRSDDFRSGFAANILGLPSALQPGDVPVSIGGVPVEEIVNQSLLSKGRLPDTWRAGGIVRYTIKRGDQALTVPVPIGKWSLIALVRGVLAGWSNFLVGLLYFIIGAFVFARRPRDLAAQVLFFLGTARLVMDLIFVIPLSLGDSGNTIAISGVALLGYYIWGILLFPTLFLFSLVFPRPKQPFRTYPLLTLAFLYLLEPVMLLFVSGVSADAGAFVGFGLVAVFGLLTVISVVHTLITERGDLVARAQILWVGLGVALVAGFQFFENITGFIFNFGPPPWWINLIGSLVYLAIPITVAIAILRYHLWDIDLLIRRTLVYSLLSTSLVLVYYGGVVGMQAILTGGLAKGAIGNDLAVSGQLSTVVIVLTTLAIAALFNPLRRRIQDFIDRRFYRKKYNAEQALERFAASARAETDLEALTAQVVNIVEDTMQPEKVSLRLIKGKRNEQTF